MGVPAGLVTSLCTGHGVCVPAAVHMTVPCGTPCPAVPKLPVAAKNATCYWPPLVCTPLTLVPCTVLINGIIPLLMGDALIIHPSPCTNIVMVGPCGTTPPVPVPCPCSSLAAEDNLVGHPRIVKALTQTVRVMGRGLSKIGDPLGPPCLSFIGTGSPNVLVGP